MSLIATDSTVNATHTLDFIDQALASITQKTYDVNRALEVTQDRAARSTHEGTIELSVESASAQANAAEADRLAAVAALNQAQEAITQQMTAASEAETAQTGSEAEMTASGLAK